MSKLKKIKLKRFLATHPGVAFLQLYTNTSINNRI
jgi:hypothetical protein